jgi:hypothetical protein
MNEEKLSALKLWKDLEPGMAPKSGHAKENILYIHARYETQMSNIHGTLYPLCNKNDFQHKYMNTYKTSLVFTGRYFL